MTAKEYLQQLHKADVIINQRIQEKADLRARLSSIGAGYERQIARIIDLENEIDSLIDDYVDLKHKIIGEIHNMKKPDHIRILYKRYVENKRLEQIAVEMNYTYQYVRELHGYALQEFETTYTNLH